MIHGLRNNNSGALSKFVIAQKRLKQLKYNHHVVGFSYDSNTVGVQYNSHAIHALNVGIIIAKDVPTDKCIRVTISKSKTVKA